MSMNIGLQQFTFNADQERLNEIERKKSGLFSNLFGKNLKASATVVQGEGTVLQETKEAITSHGRTPSKSLDADVDDFDFNPRGRDSSSIHSTTFDKFVSPTKTTSKTRVDTPSVHTAIRSNYEHASKSVTSKDIR